MASVSLQLPLKTSEAGTLAGLVLQQAQGRRLDNDRRSRLGARIQGLRLISIAPLAGSLQQDPIHPDTYYMVADTRGEAVLPLTLEAHRDILRFTGITLAAVPVKNQTYVDAVLWAAIRVGWRAGYTLEADLNALDRPPAGSTKFSLWSTELERIDRVGRRFDLEVAFDSTSSTPKTIRSVPWNSEVARTPGAIRQTASRRRRPFRRDRGCGPAARGIARDPLQRLLPAVTLQQIGRATAGKVAYQICQPGTHQPALLITTALEHRRG